MVFVTRRVRFERRVMREPEVRAKVSGGEVVVVGGEGEREIGVEMWVMGADCGEGRSSCDLKERQ